MNIPSNEEPNIKENSSLTKAMHSIDLDKNLDKWDELFATVNELFAEHN